MAPSGRLRFDPEVFGYMNNKRPSAGQRLLLHIRSSPSSEEAGERRTSPTQPNSVDVPQLVRLQESQNGLANSQTNSSGHR